MAARASIRPRRIAVFGHNGLLGRALADAVDAACPQAARWGLSRGRAPRSGWKTLPCDLRDAKRLPELLAKIRPDWIFHLAGVPVVDDARGMLDGYLTPTANLLAAVYALKERPVVVLPGSAAEYGIVPPSRLPVEESQEANPVAYYGAAKAAQTALARVYANRGLDVRVARIFNVLGPGLGTYMALASFVRQVVRIERGLKKPVLETGNLAPKRDFVDANDTAQGLLAVALHGKAGEAYNLCSGRSHSIAQLTRALLALSHRKIGLRTQNARLRPADIPDMRGSSRKALKHLGWKARTPALDSLRAMLEHDRRLTDLG